MDSILCWRKLSSFGLKEMKQVLSLLGLSKSDPKEVLFERIAGVLCGEEGPWLKTQAEKFVQDTYREMRGASTRRNESQEDVDNNIRCLCSSSNITSQMIKCEDSSCQKLQHTECVIIPRMIGNSTHLQDIFYCQLCRLSRADPFWLTISHTLYPVKWIPTSSSGDAGTNVSNQQQCIERTFQLTRAERHLLLQQLDRDLQVWCMVLNDNITFRMQWPQNVQLIVNGFLVTELNNSRDDGPIITHHSRSGCNKITLTASDARVFCFGVRVVKRRTMQQILELIPGELEGEKLEDAVGRVRRCLGGAASEDCEVEVVGGRTTVSLRCPLSGSRMKVAGRFKLCHHLGCFDLHVFLEMSQQSRKWLCPHCGNNNSLEDLIIDPYFNLLASKMRDCEEDIVDVEIKRDGSWRAKVEEGGDVGLWHYPDGTPQGSEIQPQPTSSHGQVVVHEDLKTPSSAIILIDSDSEDNGPIPSGTPSYHEGIGTCVTTSPPPPRGMPKSQLRSFRLFGRDLVTESMYNLDAGTSRSNNGGTGIKQGGEASGPKSQQQQKPTLGEASLQIGISSLGSSRVRSRERSESAFTKRSVKPRANLSS